MIKGDIIWERCYPSLMSFWRKVVITDLCVDFIHHHVSLDCLDVRLRIYYWCLDVNVMLNIVHCSCLGWKRRGMRIAWSPPNKKKTKIQPRQDGIIFTSKIVHMEGHPSMAIPCQSYRSPTQWQRNKQLCAHFFNFKSQNGSFVGHMMYFC